MQSASRREHCPQPGLGVRVCSSIFLRSSCSHRSFADVITLVGVSCACVQYADSQDGAVTANAEHLEHEPVENAEDSVVHDQAKCSVASAVLSQSHLTHRLYLLRGFVCMCASSLSAFVLRCTCSSGSWTKLGH